MYLMQEKTPGERSCNMLDKPLLGLSKGYSSLQAPHSDSCTIDRRPPA
jgi:hypothetical protein